MNKLDFEFEQSPWEATFEHLKKGSSLSAVRFLTVMEDSDEETIEDAFEDLQQKHISLDLSDLPKPTAAGEDAVRLRMEQQLAAKGNFLNDLEKGDPLRIYLEELARIPSCGDPEVLALRSAAGEEEARNLLMNASLHRVVALAQEYVGWGVMLLDLIQEGSLGLWQGILAYQSGSFESQRDWWIRHYMAKTVIMQARAGGMVQKMRQAAEDYRMVDERLLSELGRNPTLEEIAQQLHMSPEEAGVVEKMMQDAFLVDRAKGGSKPVTEPEEEERPVEDTAYFQSRQRIAELLSELDPREAELLTLRFGLEGELPMTPEETGKRLGLTPDEVVTREAAALSKLRQG